MTRGSPPQGPSSADRPGIPLAVPQQVEVDPRAVRDPRGGRPASRAAPVGGRPRAPRRLRWRAARSAARSSRSCRERGRPAGRWSARSGAPRAAPRSSVTWMRGWSVGTEAVYHWSVTSHPGGLRCGTLIFRCYTPHADHQTPLHGHPGRAGDRRVGELVQPYRLHSSIEDIPPVEVQQDYAERIITQPPPDSSRPTGSLRWAASGNPMSLTSASRCRTPKRHNPVSVELGWSRRPAPSALPRPLSHRRVPVASRTRPRPSGGWGSSSCGWARRERRHDWPGCRGHGPQASGLLCPARGPGVQWRRRQLRCGPDRRGRQARAGDRRLIRGYRRLSAIRQGQSRKRGLRSTSGI